MIPARTSPATRGPARARSRVPTGTRRQPLTCGPGSRSRPRCGAWPNAADSSAQQAQRPGGEPHAGGLGPGGGPDGTIEPVDPALLEAFGLDPEIIHLNHGAFGVAPVVVRQAAARWRERAERNPHRFNRVELSGLIAT